MNAMNDDDQFTAAAAVLEGCAAAFRAGDAFQAVELWEVAREAVLYADPRGLNDAILSLLDAVKFGHLWLSYSAAVPEKGADAAADAACDAAGVIRTGGRAISARYFRARMGLLQVLTPVALANMEALQAAFPETPPEAFLAQGLEVLACLFAGGEKPAWLADFRFTDPDNEPEPNTQHQ